MSNNECYFTSTTKVKGMNTLRGGSSGVYRKLADMVWTWHGAAERSRYEQRWSEKLVPRQLTTVYGRQAVSSQLTITRMRYSSAVNSMYTNDAVTKVLQSFSKWCRLVIKSDNFIPCISKVVTLYILCCIVFPLTFSLSFWLLLTKMFH